MEQFTKPVEGQHYGQETVATHSRSKLTVALEAFVGNKSTGQWLNYCISTEEHYFIRCRQTVHRPLESGVSVWMHLGFLSCGQIVEATRKKSSLRFHRYSPFESGSQ